MKTKEKISLIVGSALLVLGIYLICYSAYQQPRQWFDDAHIILGGILSFVGVMICVSVPINRMN